jgi:hypothetical protein
LLQGSRTNETACSLISGEYFIDVFAVQVLKFSFKESDRVEFPQAPDKSNLALYLPFIAGLFANNLSVFS